MKKFKSLMLAALATAAMAAPSFADNHGGANYGITGVSGEVILGLKYSTNTPDGGDTTTVQSTYIGDVNFKLKSDFYNVEIEKDDEDSDANVNFEMHGKASSGDNSVAVYAEIQDLTGSKGGEDASALGDIYFTGSNKTLSLKVGQYGLSENYAGGLGYFRAAYGLSNGNQFADGSEHLLIPGFRGLQLNVGAGDISFEAAVPWMSVSSGEYALTEGGADIATNMTGIRPMVKLNTGSVNVMALFYTLSFSAQDGGADPDDKSDQGFQLMGGMKAGSADVGLGYTSRTKKTGSTEVTPNVLNGYVTVALGGGQSVGASFDIIKDGAETDEATATRISASYGMPFFVESVAMKLGAGTATQTSDDPSKQGTANIVGAEWVYNF